MRFDLRLSVLVWIVLAELLAVGGIAAPESFDGDLVRAEVVFVGRIVRRKGDKVTLKPTRTLRGTRTKNLQLSGWSLPDEAGTKVEYLLISQGDNKFGKPEPTAMRLNRGQMVWRGWVAYPILKDGEEEFVKWAIGGLDGKWWDDHSAKLGIVGLSMDHVKLLLERIPYNGHVNDHLPNASEPPAISNPSLLPAIPNFENTPEQR